MNFATYLPIFLLFVIIFIVLRNRKRIIAKKTIERKRNGDKNKMKELAKRFIDKECVITSFDNGKTFDGIIREVTDGALLIEKDGKAEAINLDFVIRIREYPKNKNGKKKSVILD